MQYNRLIVLFCALALCLYSAAAAPQLQLDRRQDDTTSRPANTASESIEATSTTIREDSSTSRTPSPSKPKEKGSDASATSAPTSVMVSTTVNAPSATASSSTETRSSTELPIQPKITPALGLAGVIFILSGAVYTVIGIKNKWLYVFTSAAYLTSLAVTVLIVYLMSPPVSNAVQGAFFVAACVSGLMFGALSLVFADITEGLGCLLGGFCLSMWLLTLKEGSLIESTAGRVILIGCMSVAGYGLSWSRYTREYGLIACTSFSGATIVMLGIDCFSRAGLKEFWIYLWNLNPDIFPLYTDTYPMTRGLKAELAGVVIFAIFGIISQLRVWKLVKEHRAKSTTQRLERARDQELEEEERGRKIEDKFQEERAQWEATYDHKNSQDSGSEDSVRDEKSLAVKNVEVQASPDDKTEQPLDKGAPVTVTVVQDDVIDQIDATGNPLTQTPDPVHRSSEEVSNTGSEHTPPDPSGPGQLSRNLSMTDSLRPSAPPPPFVVPLPFKVPQNDDAKSQTSDNASISAVPDIEDDGPPNRMSVSKRISDMSEMKQHSTTRVASNRFESEEAVCDFQAQSDRASSVAATLDEDLSVRELSPPASPVPNEFLDEGEDAHAVSQNVASSDQPEGPTPGNSDNSTKKVLSSNMTSSPRSLTVSTDPKSNEQRSKRTDAASQQDKNENDHDSATAPASVRGEQIDSATGSFDNLLPTEFSKVAHTFRVNEWSKHLEAAEKPEIEEIEEPISPGIHMDHERPAPVSEELARPLAVKKRNSNGMSSAEAVPHPNVFIRSNSNASQYSQAKPASVFRSSGILPAGGMSRSGSQIFIRPSRNSSSHLEPLVEPTSTSVPAAPISPLPSNTLMGQREALMKNRVSSQSFIPLSGSPNNAPVNEEDMTLAERKRALKHHQKPPSAAQKWQRSSRIPATQMQVTGFDSHPPQRNRNSASDQKRESLLAGWRESIRQESQQSHPHHQAASGAGNGSSDEQRRAALLHAKRQKEMEKQQQAAAAQQRESMMHNMMRSNEMLDAHREAMRRMQSSASKRV
ncbi:unnamed protein product [Periconia digitata]|uniref:TM7S3/TM198-like domain-containing protein n=1 Tax=Periconia digitata TaxID=1303443 RepID=A0A9W4UFQ0_9PLEO|nr:unnamed protein product [Periconia digitata]